MTPDLKSQIADQIAAGPPSRVWTPADFAMLAGRAAVDKALQRLARAGALRRIDRGLYDRPRLSSLTKKPTSPDYREVVDAIARRDQLRMLVDGMTAANDLGLTDAVPAHVIIHTDARRRSIRFDNLTIDFKLTAPSKLYWAGRPAMRVVQALHWLKDLLATDRPRILAKLADVLADPTHGAAIRQDLEAGLKTLPAWMQQVVRELLDPEHQPVEPADTSRSPASAPRPHRPRLKSGARHE
jgi:hypothetical protein